MFSKEASEEARLDEKGWKDKKRKDEAARRERTEDRKRRDKAVRREGTKRKDPLIQITNTLSKDIMINIIFIYYNIQIRIYIIILYILYSIIRIIHNLSCTKETVFLMPQTKSHSRKR